jgi:hypothetical protein
MLQKVYNKLYVKFMELREVNKLHVKNLNNLESERSKLIEKIKCLEDKLTESQMQLENFSKDKLVQMLKGQKCSYDKTDLGFDIYVASSSNIVSTSKTIFVKPKIAEPQVANMDNGKSVITCENANIKSVVLVIKHSKSRSLLTCHHCSVIGHIHPHCPQVCSQRPQIKKHDPKKVKFGTRPSRTHYAPRHRRQPSHRFVTTCHHCGKTSHNKTSCFKLKPREPKGNHMYEGCFGQIEQIGQGSQHFT